MTAIFFDLDGTLTDPKEGITKSIQYALRELDREVLSGDDLEWCIGPPLKQSFDQLLGNPSLSDDAIALYRRRFSAKGLYENAVYPEIELLLTELREKNIPLYVATSKPEIYAIQIVEHFKLDKFFERIFGSELDGKRSNKAELLEYALSETGCCPSKSLMIGDRKHDAMGAQHNGMISVGVTYGYGTASELKTAGVQHLIDKPLDLLDLMASL
ncbi:HAD family hydrolase [Kiloniella litopenaei]|uniref:HAD family hydrolase n=1 Tax=Kiloniella litopenaei TaxID=1549748 RepID=A0A0M2R9Y2_9PROT|nr:HAD family hydrolase [Kiloniella litopenaei]KKJ76413.1 HAD family hydrolase [Kiloniella litopenaei]